MVCKKFMETKLKNKGLEENTFTFITFKSSLNKLFIDKVETEFKRFNNL